MADATDVFDDSEIGYLRTLIRQEIRKTEQGIKNLYRKYGEDTDPSRPQLRIQILEGIYRKLGLDPDDITVLE